jgi:O-antigen/teichoic acid export membrane protein
MDLTSKDLGLLGLRTRSMALYRTPFFRNVMWMFSGQGLALVVQAGYFIVIARLLGNLQYGIFVGAAACVAVVSPYASLGSGFIFLRYVSPDPRKFASYWGNIIISTLSLGTLLVIGLGLAAPWLLHGQSRLLVVLMAIADCICIQLTVANSQVFQAFEKLRYTALLNLLTNTSRLLVAVVMLVAVRHASAMQWAVASLSVSLVSCCGAFLFILLHFGRPSFCFKLVIQRAWEGFIFAITGSTSSVYNDVDKVILAHQGMNVANGIYTMAYRVVDVSTMPVRSIHAAAFPRFFRYGASAEGLSATGKFAGKILKRTSILSLGMALAMVVAAPLIPFVIGKQFAASVSALRWLSLIPFFRSIHIIAGDALSSAGYQNYRLGAQAAIAVMNFGMNIYLIPRYSWHGAAWASLASDGLLAVLMWVTVFVLDRLKVRVRHPAYMDTAEELAKQL